MMNSNVSIDHLSGYLGKGPFTLSGTAGLQPPVYNLRVHALNAQLAQAKRLMQVLKIDQPLLALLQGEVREVFLNISGSPKNPQIAMTAMPSNVSFRIPF